MGTSRIVAAGAVAAMAVGAVSLSTVAQAKAATTATSPAPRAQAAVSPVSHRAHMGQLRRLSVREGRGQLPAWRPGSCASSWGSRRSSSSPTARRVPTRARSSPRCGRTASPSSARSWTAPPSPSPRATRPALAAAEADGATAVIGTAQPVETVKAKALSSPADGSSYLLGGDVWAYHISADEVVTCSTGFNGYSNSTGGREFLTAGHCADYQHNGGPAPTDGVVYAATDTDPVTLDEGVPIADPSLGSLDQPSFHFGDGEDSGIVKVTDTKARPVPDVSTWGSAAALSRTASLGAENSHATVPVIAAAAAVNGEPVCHSGATTGWQCGTVDNPKNLPYVTADVVGATKTQTVDGFATNVCDLPGDSGGSFVSGEYAVGVASASSFSSESVSGAGSNHCVGSGFTIAYPMVAAASGEESAAQSELDFELAVAVSTPVVSPVTADGVTGKGTISGYLPAPFATGTLVSLSLDGHAKAATTANSSGAWSFSLTGLGGVHSYTVTAGSGHSTASTGGTLFVSTKAPGISGTVKVGSKVVATPGAWPVTAPTYTYQWLANGKPISGATSASYTIPASLAGQKLSVTVTAHKSGYNSSADTSAAYTVAKGTFTVPVRPKLSGTPAVGKTLAVTNGTWSPAAAIAIHWYANGKPVARATGTSLRLTAALKGETVGVTVTGSKAGYVRPPSGLRKASRSRRSAPNGSAVGRRGNGSVLRPPRAHWLFPTWGSRARPVAGRA